MLPAAEEKYVNGAECIVEKCDLSHVFQSDNGKDVFILLFPEITFLFGHISYDCYFFDKNNDNYLVYCVYVALYFAPIQFHPISGSKSAYDLT